MNHPFIQMLRFELKLNRKMWIIITAISLVLLAILNLLNSPIFKPILFSFLFFVTLLFTLLSYQETTHRQSLNLYHLIPVNQNIKFLTKIFITLFAFPAFLLAFNYLLSFMGQVANRGYTSHSQSLELLASISTSSQIVSIMCFVWLFFQSGSTLVAIVFKKYKILYAMLIYWGIQLFLSPLILIVALKPLINNSTRSAQVVQQPSNSPTWIIPLLIVLALVIYSFSYRLFIRRKL
jgi:hypothetical protein